MTTSIIEKVIQDPELIGLLAREIVEEQRQKTVLWETLAVVQPQAEYFDQFVNPEDCTNIRCSRRRAKIIFAC